MYYLLLLATFDRCYLRYDDYNFFNESLSPVDSAVCATEQFSGNTSAFESYVTEVGKNLSLGAPENGGFLVGSVTRGNASVYGLAQCWRFTDDCGKCLNDSFSRVISCPPRKEGRAISAGCYLRYSTEKFYYNNTVTAAGGRNSGKPILSQEQILRFLRSLSSTSSEKLPVFSYIRPAISYNSGCYVRCCCSPGDNRNHSEEESLEKEKRY